LEDISGKIRNFIAFGEPGFDICDALGDHLVNSSLFQKVQNTSIDFIDIGRLLYRPFWHQTDDA
jgi:hypothetical protein